MGSFDSVSLVTWFCAGLALSCNPSNNPFALCYLLSSGSIFRECLYSSKGLLTHLRFLKVDTFVQLDKLLWMVTPCRRIRLQS